MQAYQRQRIVGSSAIVMVSIALGCAHSRPRYTEEIREVHTSPAVRVPAPFVDVEVPVTTKRDKEQARLDDERQDRRWDD